MVEIKGAPVTFDLEKLTEIESDIILLEGNYLLLDEDGWRDLSAFADYTISVRAEEAFLRTRLIDRKKKTGADAEAAERFVDYSDMPNVRICLEKTKPANLRLMVDSEGNFRNMTEQAFVANGSCDPG